MRVLRMVGCECRVMSVLVDCVMVVMNVGVLGSCLGHFRGHEWVLVLIFSVLWPSISC